MPHGRERQTRAHMTDVRVRAPGAPCARDVPRTLHIRLPSLPGLLRASAGSAAASLLEYASSLFVQCDGAVGCKKSEKSERDAEEEEQGRRGRRGRGRAR